MFNLLLYQGLNLVTNRSRFEESRTKIDVLYEIRNKVDLIDFNRQVITILSKKMGQQDIYGISSCYNPDVIKYIDMWLDSLSNYINKKSVWQLDQLLQI